MAKKDQEIFNVGVIIAKAAFVGFFEKGKNPDRCRHLGCGFIPAAHICPKCGSTSRSKKDQCYCQSTWSQGTGYTNATNRDLAPAGPKPKCNRSQWKELSINDVSNPRTEIQYVALRCNAIYSSGWGESLKDCIFVVDMKKEEFLPGDFACSAPHKKTKKRTLYDGRHYKTDPTKVVNRTAVIKAIWEIVLP